MFDATRILILSTAAAIALASAAVAADLEASPKGLNMHALWLAEVAHSAKLRGCISEVCGANASEYEIDYLYGRAIETAGAVGTHFSKCHCLNQILVFGKPEVWAIAGIRSSGASVGAIEFGGPRGIIYKSARKLNELTRRWLGQLCTEDAAAAEATRKELVALCGHEAIDAAQAWIQPVIDKEAETRRARAERSTTKTLP